MFEENLKNLLQMSKFTTCKIQKTFLPRRIGLGYNFKYENAEINLLKEIKKKQNKKIKLYEKNKNFIDEESEEEVFTKSKILK